MISNDERVQVAGRLIGDDRARVVDERAGDGRPLLLAAGRWLGSWLPGGQSDERQDPVHRGAMSRRSVPVTSSAALDGLRREELEVLEDDRSAADPRHLAARQPGDVLPVEDDRARGRDRRG